jgi:hypothetical protein
MIVKKRTLAILALGTITAAAAQAQTSGFGYATDTLTVMSQGPDIFLQEYLPGAAGQFMSYYHGQGTYGFNYGAVGGDYFYVAAGTTADGVGDAYNLTSYGVEIMAYNHGTQAESVSFYWYGFALSEASASLGGQYSWDINGAGLFDSAQGLVFSTSADSASNGLGSAFNTDSGDYTVILAPGASDEILSWASNKAFSSSGYVNSNPTPGPAAMAPFALGLVGLARKRILRKR